MEDILSLSSDIMISYAFMYMQMELWTLLHNSSHSIKEPNQTMYIRTNIQAYRYLQNIFLFLWIGLLLLRDNLGIEFQGVKSI